MTRTVELVFDHNCPNVEAARQQLRRAFEAAGQPAQWQEWERSSASAPARARQYGSPTILVDGKDVIGSKPTEGADCCRLYVSGRGGFQGVPDVEVIVAALRPHAANPSGFREAFLPSWLAMIPAVGVAISTTEAELSPCCQAEN